jgi:hypothetical protein
MSRQILLEKPQGVGRPGRVKSQWVQETGWQCVDWVHLAQVRCHHRAVLMVVLYESRTFCVVAVIIFR